MKSLIKVSKKILIIGAILFALLMTNPFNTHATATFTAATTAESNTTGSSVINTGNDVKGTYQVWVCDGSSPTFSWINGTHYGSSAIGGTNGYNVSDPDVSLIFDGTEYWAIIVYWSAHFCCAATTGDWVYELWEYDNVGNAFNYINWGI